MRARCPHKGGSPALKNVQMKNIFTIPYAYLYGILYHSALTQIKFFK